jgi:hypothetical protein
MAPVARISRTIMFVRGVILGIVVVFMGVVGVRRTIVGQGIARVERVRPRSRQMNWMRQLCKMCIMVLNMKRCFYPWSHTLFMVSVKSVLTC